MAERPASWKLLAAFAAVYVIWGSTYLGIRVAVETIPPFLMAGIRQAVAGVVLFGWLRWRGAPWPERVHWKSATIIGALMLLVGNGGVAWAERRVPSGLTALLIATSPLWMALLDWVWLGARRPTARMLTGLTLGLVGAGLLVVPGRGGAETPVDAVGAMALLVATWGWTAGALYSRRATLPAQALVGAALEMLTGGLLLVAVSGLVGEWRGFGWAQVSARSWWALGYLTVFGSMLTYSAYMWLLKVSTPARVSTSAFVNPVIAVVLGWWLLDEAITSRILVAAGVIVGAVILIMAQSVSAVEPAEPV